jgi:hypothetical protein
MAKDLIQKIIVVLSVEYLLFFSAEVVLPGVIANVFNINILLLIILILVSVLVSFKDDKHIKIKGNSKDVKNKYLLLLGVGLLGINIIALYKSSVAMIIVYIVVTGIITKLLWNNK